MSLHGVRVLRPLRDAKPDDRRIGETTDEDARKARAGSVTVAAWGAITFYRNDEMGVIVRDDSEGTHGWQYATVGACLLDWSEIAGMALKLRGSGDAELWSKNEDERP